MPERKRNPLPKVVNYPKKPSPGDFDIAKRLAIIMRGRNLTYQETLNKYDKHAKQTFIPKRHKEAFE